MQWNELAKKIEKKPLCLSLAAPRVFRTCHSLLLNEQEECNTQLLLRRPRSRAKKGRGRGFPTSSFNGENGVLSILIRDGVG